MTIKRQVFYSFHYQPDSWRVSQVRNIGVVDGNEIVSDNDWEDVKKCGDKGIRVWIDGSMLQRTCTVVLVGSNTANRKWINYEIEKSWDDGMGVVGIYIHGLKDRNRSISKRGRNPFDYAYQGSLSKIVKCYHPHGFTSQHRYDWISQNLSRVIEEAIQIRAEYK